MRGMMMFIIRLYQYLVSPFMPSCCRFYPSCSQYAWQAFHQHGISKGLWLACCRLLRCHPWANGGYDPVLPDSSAKVPNLLNQEKF